MTQVNITSTTNTVVATDNGISSVVSVATAGPQGPQGPPGESGLFVNTTAKVDKSIVYYDASEDTFKADSTWTTSSLTDGGNF
jgi:hypothetical protein